MERSRIQNIVNAIEGLTEGQLSWVETVVQQFTRPHEFNRSRTSDLITECVLRDFGDTLRIHHCFSNEAFSKDKFEYALCRVLNNCGVESQLAPKGNPGHDITIAGVPVSLKTQANSAIKDDQIWVSKFMEMGKGDWVEEAHLAGLRQRFFDHMNSYDRIFTLRCLKMMNHRWRYELVEIPKALLLEAANGRLVMMHNSRQTPKPGYCHVTDENGRTKFDLYFDGGTERKLQIKNLDKSFCVVHGAWSFEAG